MPIQVYIGESIAMEISQQLGTIRTGNNPAAVLARKIGCIGSASIFLEDNARHDPDKEFGYEGAIYPSVIIEIAYSQTKKKLSRLADHYIVESSGQIQMVIGIELDSRGSKSATVRSWCPIYGVDDEGRFLASEEISSHVCQTKDTSIGTFNRLSKEFRRTDGTAVADKALRLQLKDFVPRQIEADPDGLAHEILIPFEKLAMFVDEAESRQNTKDIPAVLEAGVRKRRRPSTPLEELN